MPKKLTEILKKNILDGFCDGKSLTSLSKEFGYSPSTITRAVKSFLTEEEYIELKKGKGKPIELKSDNIDIPVKSEIDSSTNSISQISSSIKTIDKNELDEEVLIQGQSESSQDFIEIAPLSYIRGRTFNDAIVLVDEAQNATIHELKTIITRIGAGSKIVLLGDTDQIDTPYINKRSNGLSIVISKFANSNLSAHVHLSRGQRSDLATEASKIL